MWSLSSNFYFGPVNFLISGCFKCHANIVEIYQIEIAEIAKEKILGQHRTKRQVCMEQ